MKAVRQLGFALGLMLWASPLAAQGHGTPEHGAEHASEGHEAAGHAEEEHHGEVTLGAILHDPNFRASVVSFGLLALLLYFGARRKVRAALEGRRREIEEAVAEARRREEEAEAKRKEFEERLARLDAEMERIREEVIKAGEEERDRIVQEAEEKAALIRRDAQFQIEQQMKQLREELTAEAIEAAVGAATELLAKSTTPDDQRRLAQGYLEAVASMTEEKRA